jgi:hypothetical protein
MALYVMILFINYSRCSSESAEKDVTIIRLQSDLRLAHSKIDELHLEVGKVDYQS